MFPAEKAIFAREQQRIARGPVLDIGIGAGRTTAFLAMLSGGYFGVDYSAAMINHCRGRFAENSKLSFTLADAASMPMFEDESFEFVFFSFNGIDSVDHAHRLSILREIYRVLRKDGRFAFSAHNRNYAYIQRRPRFQSPLRPRGMARTGLELLNHLRARGKTFSCRDYELINDPAHLFRMITYYIDRHAQIAQLERSGFRVLDVLDSDGRSVSDEGGDRASPNLHYLTERRP